MNPDVDWEEIGPDAMQPILIGDILPEVLASYGLGKPSVDGEQAVLCEETATPPFAMAEVS
jgi:hypothetical protein